MVRNFRYSRRLATAFGVAIVCSLAVSAASASATTLNWYSCAAGGGKNYSDSECTKFVSGNKGAYDWQKLSKQKDFSMKGTTPFVLKWSYGGGTSLTTTCTSQTATGYKISNEEKTGGKISEGFFSLFGCTTKAGSKTCSTTIPQIVTTGAPTELAGKPALRFQNSGSGFFNVYLGEACGLSMGPYPFSEGSFTGIVNSATSSLEFTAAGSSFKYAGSIPATLEGTSKMGTSATEPGAGEALKLAP